MKKDLSVIIPVYNAEKHLKECLDSLEAQTLKGIEFIFINDGSKDNSIKILEDYKKNNPDWIVAEQENCGVSAARNKGLEIASGEYIGFVDADDWIKPEMFQMLLTTAKENNADIVTSSYYRVFEDKNGQRKAILVPNRGQTEVINVESESEIFLDEVLNVNTLFKKDIIDKYNIKFPENLALCEDFIFQHTAYMYAERIKYISEAFYYYRCNQTNSLSAKANPQTILQIDYLKKIYNDIKSTNKNFIIKWYNHFALSVLAFGYAKIEVEYKDEFFEKFCGFVKDAEISSGKDIAYPSLRGKGFMNKVKYLILRFTHPLMVFALRNHYRKMFNCIIDFREFLTYMIKFLKGKSV